MTMMSSFVINDDEEKCVASAFFVETQQRFADKCFKIELETDHHRFVCNFMIQCV